jgi:hypothetical protein
MLVTTHEGPIEARAGDFAFSPRGVPHRYTVGDGGCRMLFIMTRGFEALVREVCVPARARTLPRTSDEEPDWEHVAVVARAHGCELLG